MIRIGSGLDVHAFAPERHRPLVLGGVHIPDAPGLEGHSDADVVAHAVTDALLGATAAGDLGSRFGTDRAEHADADSLALLATVVADLVTGGWRLGNLDVTVVAARPRLAPHRDDIRASLATTLHAGSTGDVSVKLTTTDGLGAVGRGEGIAAWAVALLEAERP